MDKSLIKEWHPTKNEGLNPELITNGSHKKVWWKCAKGHEWAAVVYSRYKGRECPYCTNRLLLRGFNDLKTVNPQLASEWNYEKNIGLPEDYFPSSHKDVWWRCSKGHEWKSKIHNRNINNTGCPYCTGRLPIQGINDLETLYPDVAKEWHPTKNGDLKPSEVLQQANKKVWWLCSKGHEWQAFIYNRVNGNKCPYCTHKKAIPGENDFTIVHPELLKEWCYQENEGLSPSDYLPNASKKVTWECQYNHKWKASIANRCKGRKCPYCAEEKAIKGKNDLKTLYPEIVKEWDYEKNGKLGPENYLPRSGKSVYWKCSHGHEWKSKIVSRTKGGKCPICRREERKR